MYPILSKIPHLHAFCNIGINNCIRILQANNYSVFPPTFVKPVFHPDQFNNLSPEDIRELRHKKILPPTISENASVFYDPLLAKLENYIMKGGNKQKSRELVQAAFTKIKRAQIRKFHLEKDPDERKKIPTNPLEIFHKALENCKPVLNVTSVKRGAVVYKVPVHIEDKKATFLAFSWIIDIAREKPRRTSWNEHSGEFFSDKLAKEIMDAFEKSGKAIQKKLDLHRLCESNKAYAHYRWTK